MSEAPSPDFPRSPVSLPKRKVGRFEVAHRYAREFDIVSVREAITTGRKPLSVTLPKPIRIHQLFEDDSLWIGDWPVEVRQHQEAMRAMMPLGGRVLVGGLGLGIMAALLAREPAVERVEVVEISPEVVTLCRPRDPKVSVIVSDLRAFLTAQSEWPWSAAFIDIWRGTDEATWWDTVMPLRRLIRRKFGEVAGVLTQYWGEDIMLGQVGKRLLNVTRPHWYYREGLRLPMSLRRARWFVQNIGSPAWERRYGSLYPEDQGGEQDAANG